MSGERERVRALRTEPRGVVRELRPPAFGEILRQFRRVAGLTQEQLAERAGLSAAGISALERGTRANPQRETVRLLAEALALAPDDRQRLEVAVAPRPAPNAGGDRPLGLPGFIPLPVGDLIGRDEDIGAVAALLGQDTTRLVTIVGPGGIGKTRLALAVAARNQGRYRDGVTFLALDTIRTADDVLPLLARRLGLGDQQRGPLLPTVVTALCERTTLLVLDNIEHLPLVGAVIGAILQACPGCGRSPPAAPRYGHRGRCATRWDRSPCRTPPRGTRRRSPPRPPWRSSCSAAGECARIFA